MSDIKHAKMASHQEIQAQKRKFKAAQIDAEASEKPLANYNTLERAQKLHPVVHDVYDKIMADEKAKKLAAQRVKNAQLDQEMHRKIQNMDSPSMQQDDKGLDLD